MPFFVNECIENLCREKVAHYIEWASSVILKILTKVNDHEIIMKIRLIWPHCILANLYVPNRLNSTCSDTTFNADLFCTDSRQSFVIKIYECTFQIMSLSTMYVEHDTVMLYLSLLL
jgi:hypothetical protein